MQKRNHNTLLLFAVAIAVIVFVANQKRLDNKNFQANRSRCYTEMEKSFCGTVSSCYYDDAINVKAFVINFSNGQKYINPFFLRSLNGKVERGDSICKVKGTFRFQVFKQGYGQTFLKDTVDCEDFQKERYQ